MCPERSDALRCFFVRRGGACAASAVTARGLHRVSDFDVMIKCITFADASVPRSRLGRSGDQKGNGCEARTVPAAVCSSASRRICRTALFNHWSRGIGKAPPPERVRRPAGAVPSASRLRRTGGCRTLVYPDSGFWSYVRCLPPALRAASGCVNVLRRGAGAKMKGIV